MKLVIFTIVLDGMPFLKWQYECFQKLTCDWQWIICEGAAMNGGSTKWCRPQIARYSSDGTIDFIEWLRFSDSRVVIRRKAGWSSKDAMCNVALDQVKEPCILMQIDVDELWKPEAIDKVVELFENEASLGAIKTYCRYFVGPKLICEGENCWSNNDYEWLRVWRFHPGARFISHEPPVLSVVTGRMMDREEAASHGLTFDHLAYVTEAQVEYKSKFYSADYSDAVNQWRALQSNQHWPAKLSRFFPWVHGELPTVNKI